MTPERWRQVAEAFEAALELSGEERKAFLQQLEISDPTLRTEVETLLAEDAAHPAPEGPTPGAAGAAGMIGRRIGSYEIVRVIGEGGMGVVFEARQEQPRRAVALKVLKPGLAGPDVLRRFERESQVLARLQHPGIAQIYEAGTADTGFGPQPYFAMELIQGMPLREYAESRQLSTRQRLEIMALVCDAVEHAHQRGIIHRDLKPGNILVDETGQPKVLDFGVARVTDSDMQATRQTDVGQLIGTLSYMSPEQVLADPLELDTRSDVYALGVVLYELLAKRLPYPVSDLLHEAVRVIREEDPTKLSSINRAFRGDVETIVSRALEKDKARRYASASGLATDVRRYLADEPIMARPASATYQLRKFARRHKGLVSAVGVVFAVLVAGILVTTREAARARQAEQTAQAVNDFLQNDLLAQASASTQASPNTKPDPDLKVRTALDRAAARIGGKFAAQPLVEASIRETIGNTYLDLGLYSEAQKQLERAVEMRSGIQGEKNSDTLIAMRELASVYFARTNFKEAEKVLKEVLPLRRRLSGDQSPLTVTVIQDLANTYANEAKYGEAEPLLVQAVEIYRRQYGERNPNTFNAMNDLGVLYRKEGKYEKARNMYQRVLDIKRRVLGSDHPDTLLTMNTLGVSYLYEGQFQLAEELLKRTLEARRRVLGDDHPSTLLTMNNLGLAYDDEGKYAQSEALLRQTLAARERISGPENADTLLTAINLGDVLDSERKDQEAETLIRHTLEISRRLYGEDNPHTQQLTVMLARLRERAKDYAEAEALFAAALESRVRVLGKDHDVTMLTATNLGRVRFERHEYASAEMILRATLVSYQKSEPGVWQRYACESQLGQSLAAQRKYDEAESRLISGYEGLNRERDRIAPFSRYLIDEARGSLVKLYGAWGKPNKAAEWAALPAVEKD